MQIIPLPSFESSDPEVAKTLLRLKQHLSVCIRTLQPMRKWESFLRKRGITDTSVYNPQTLVDVINVFDYGHPLGELFNHTKTRAQIFSDRNLAAEIISLITQVPSTHIKRNSDELSFLRAFPWDQFPMEWKPWIDAIKVLDHEAQTRLFITKYEETVKPSPYKQEPFDRAGIDFVERDEHFWWAGRFDEDEQEKRPLKDDEMTIVEEEVTKKVEAKVMRAEKFEPKKVEPVASPIETRDRSESMRGELWRWTPGGDCPA